MFRQIRSLAACSALMLCTILTMISSAEAGQICLNVEARKGWQNFNIPPLRLSDFSISGDWTVEVGTYPDVDFRGYAGGADAQITRQRSTKLRRGYPNGMLLVDIGRGIVSANIFARQLKKAAAARSRVGGRYRFRINEVDAALGDNSGAIRICLMTP
ncbi:MAG: hypothetical protein HWE23_01530 [Rhodobacteraceae bacterium]|nr:hypothetical protein [Paracoccaceae bacterium]